MSVWNGHYACTCYHPLFVFNQFGDLERCTLRPGNVHSADGSTQARREPLPGQSLTYLFSKLRACDLVRLKVRDICHNDRVAARAIVMQQKTSRSVQFEITESTREAVAAWIKEAGLRSEDYLFPSRLHKSLHLSTRQYAHIVDSWVEEIGLDPADYGTHSMRRMKASLIYRRTKNLRAVQLLLGHTKLDNTLSGPNAKMPADSTNLVASSAIPKALRFTRFSSSPALSPRKRTFPWATPVVPVWRSRCRTGDGWRDRESRGSYAEAGLLTSFHRELHRGVLPGGDMTSGQVAAVCHRYVEKLSAPRSHVKILSQSDMYS
jgi:Phage integrase family/Transposase DDE domain group 1